MFPPLFNSRYPRRWGDPGGPGRIRKDLSVTLCLAEPEEYDRGELTVEDKYRFHAVKRPAGDMVLYPAIGMHQVQTRHPRYAACFFFLVANHDP